MAVCLQRFFWHCSAVQRVGGWLGQSNLGGPSYLAWAIFRQKSWFVSNMVHGCCSLCALALGVKTCNRNRLLVKNKYHEWVGEWKIYEYEYE